LDGLMVNHSASVYIGQGLTGQAAAFFFLVEPGGKGLFYDPVLGTFQAGGNVIDSLSQIDRHMSSN
jgi:hypothetical protein|tara:strand:- start:166 stop:363 length:198 start_codon:yes stop_codon:yes gene_type:complete